MTDTHTSVNLELTPPEVGQLKNIHSPNFIKKLICKREKFPYPILGGQLWFMRLCQSLALQPLIQSIRYYYTNHEFNWLTHLWSPLTWWVCFLFCILAPGTSTSTSTGHRKYQLTQLGSTEDSTQQQCTSLDLTILLFVLWVSH